MKRVDLPVPKAFQPFTLTVETEEEARLLACLTGAITHKAQVAIGVSGGTASAVYSLLSAYRVDGLRVLSTNE